MKVKNLEIDMKTLKKILKKKKMKLKKIGTKPNRRKVKNLEIDTMTL